MMQFGWLRGTESGLRVAVAFAVVLAGSVATTAAYADEAVDGEFARLLELMEGDAERVEELAAAHMVGELRPYLVPEDYVEGLTGAAQGIDEPLARFVARRRAARADLERGAEESFGGSEGFAADQSCLVDWELVGPFSNSAMEGFEQRLEPELGEAGPYRGRNAEVDWRSLSTGHHLCVYRLGSRVHPSTSAVAYLGTTVEVEDSREAKLLVGSQGPYRIWVNGQPVGQRTTEHGLGLDAEGWFVELEEGSNEILVKLASSGQGGLSWMARLVDRHRRPLDEWTATAGIDAREVAPFEAVGMPDGGARMVVERALEAGQASASHKLAAAVVWNRLYSDDGSTPWRDIAEGLMEHRDQLSARELIWLGRLYEEHWQRQEIFDEAVLRGQGDHFVRWHRAEQWGRTLSRMKWERQRRELSDIVDEAPGFLAAVESLARWYEEHETSARALRVIERWEADERERTPAWVRYAASLHRSAGDAPSAARLRRQAADVHQLSGTFGWRLMREAVAAGDVDEARRLVEDYRYRAPWSQRWGLHQAMLARSTGQIDEALAVVDALIEEAPGDATLRKRRAELLVVTGDVDQAMQAVEEAIALRPQATRYQRYLDHLRPESSRFYEPWVITELEALSEDTEEGSQDWDMLVDQRIHQVASNGLSSRFEQRAHRVLRDEGIGGARRVRVSFRPGDERVEVIGARVIKADGTISEDYDDWTTEQTRRGARTYNDRGYVHIRANNVDAGDIVEFQYVLHQVANENFRGDYFGDIRYVQRTRPVAMSRYGVIYPDDWDLSFRAPRQEHRRWDGELPDGTEVDDRRVTYFELRDVPRVHTEDDRPGHADVYDYVLVSNKKTHDQVAAWWWDLIEEQLVVDDAIRSKVAELTEGLDRDDEKLEAIYEYVVRNTRYLHLGLGIHGWKPYRTSTVFRNRYGDCKDKAALVKVMLEEAGIDAQMVLVRTRRLGSVDDEPASMHIFNHAVTYVPSMDLFLDPTARFNGPYELTQMDQGAQALIVTDEGEGKWVRMPVDEADDNLEREELEVDLTRQTPVMTGRVEAHGANAVRDRRRLEDSERRDERFEDRLRRRFPGLELLEAEYEELDSLTNPTTIRYSAEVPGALRGGQGSASVYPYVDAAELLDRYARTSTRRQDLTFRVPFSRQATVRYRLPPDLAVEEIPEAVYEKSDFGEFEVSFEYAGDELVAHIRYSIAVQRVDVDDYEEFRRFIARMDQAINDRIRLIGEPQADEEAHRSDDEATPTAKISPGRHVARGINSPRWAGSEEQLPSQPGGRQ